MPSSTTAPLANNVLLTTRRNGEGSHSSGLEFTVSGKLTPELTLNTSGNLMRMQQTTFDDQGLLNTRTANSLSGRVRLNYASSAATQVQMALQMQGKMLSGQGYRSPNHLQSEPAPGADATPEHAGQRHRSVQHQQDGNRDQQRHLARDQYAPLRWPRVLSGPVLPFRRSHQKANSTNRVWARRRAAPAAPASVVRHRRAEPSRND
jgi:hypothetical protein